MLGIGIDQHRLRTAFDRELGGVDEFAAHAGVVKASPEIMSRHALGWITAGDERAVGTGLGFGPDAVRDESLLRFIVEAEEHEAMAGKVNLELAVVEIKDVSREHGRKAGKNLLANDTPGFFIVVFWSLAVVDVEVGGEIFFHVRCPAEEHCARVETRAGEVDACRTRAKAKDRRFR